MRFGTIVVADFLHRHDGFDYRRQLGSIAKRSCAFLYCFSRDNSVLLSEKVYMQHIVRCNSTYRITYGTYRDIKTDAARDVSYPPCTSDDAFMYNIKDTPCVKQTNHSACIAILP